MRRDELTRAEVRAVTRTLRAATKWRRMPSPIVTVRASRRKRARTRTIYVCTAEGCRARLWASGAAADHHAMECHPWGVTLDYAGVLDDE